MNSYSPSEIVAKYCRASERKTSSSAARLILLAVMGGMIIAFGGAVSNTAVHTISNVSAARLISGLIFPFGLPTLMLLGMELFTGNVMISMLVLTGGVKLPDMLRNWFLVYLGNFLGAVLVAAGTSLFGQMNYSDGGLAVYTLKVAVGKVSMPFSHALVSGILCNILVCSAVLCFYSAKDTAGKILGSFLPVSFFVIAGFEHSVANMYYISSALLARTNPFYEAQALAHGLNLDSLTWAHFILNNLLPVTLGNILGGSLVASIMWFSHGPQVEAAQETEAVPGMAPKTPNPAR